MTIDDIEGDFVIILKQNVIHILIIRAAQKYTLK